MRSEYWFSAFLAVLLILCSFVGNVVWGEPHRINIFPWLVALVAFPIAIYPAVRGRAKKGTVTHHQLRRTGWAIVWPAAVAFAVFTATLAAVKFARPSIRSLAITFAGTLLLTFGLGLACAEACGAIAVRRGGGTGAA